MKSSLTRLIEAILLLPRRGLLGALCAVVLVAGSPALAQVEPTHSAGRFALFVDGELVGFPRQVRGGTIKAEVVTESVGPDYIVRKHIASISHEPFTVELGMGMSRGMYDWINQSWSRDFDRRDGQVVAVDFDFGLQTRRDFFNAMISEVTFPALDASSKEPASLIVEFAPEEIVYKRGDSIRTAADVGAGQGLWTPSHFRFEMGDLPSTHVQKIDGFSIKQTVRELEPGMDRSVVPTTVEVPNLKITISMADLEPWQEWFLDFLIDGKDSDADELDGSISFRSPDMEEELGRLDLRGVGIVSLEMAAAEANTEDVPHFTVELYVEAMSFEPGGDEDGGEKHEASDK